MFARAKKTYRLMKDVTRRVLTLTLLLLTLAAAAKAQSADDNITVVTPEAFLTGMKQDGNAVVLDVRRPSEFSEGHIAAALQLNWLDKATWQNGMKCLSKEPTYYVYCRSGRRSHEAAADMTERGFKVVELEGGILNWQSHGMPVDKEE